MQQTKSKRHRNTGKLKMAKRGRNTKLKRILTERNITLDVFAAGIKTPQSYASTVVNGSANFTLGTLRKICRYLDVYPNDIIEFERWKNPVR